MGIEVESGGRAEDRTLDPLIKSQLLYQLSYASAGRDYSRKSQKSHQKGATLSPFTCPSECETHSSGLGGGRDCHNCLKGGKYANLAKALPLGS